MSDLCPPYGFALRRRGTCHEDEVGTTETWGGFHRCCPKPSNENDGACCPENTDCREELGNSRHCADSSWLLFRNTKDNGFFCCLKGYDGFLANSNGTGVGCENSFAPDNSDLLWQPRITPDNIESTCSSTSNSGAIAGGVVGGVAGLAIILVLLWYFMRRRSQKQPPQEGTPTTEASVIQSGPVLSSDKPSELSGQRYVAELENIPVHELLENPRTR